MTRLCNFASVDHETWRREAERTLQGASFERRLVTQLLEGIAVQPLYTRRDGVDAGLPASELPGAAPFTRGRTALPTRPWLIETRCSQAAPAVLRQALAEELAQGATALRLHCDTQLAAGADPSAGTTAPDGALVCSAADLAEILADVALDRVALSFESGAAALAMAAALVTVAEHRGTPLTALCGNLGCDPLGHLAHTGALAAGVEASLAELAELAAFTAAHCPALRAAQIATAPYHDAGASVVQELAIALATLVEYLRLLTGSGLTIGAACRQIAISVPLGPDIFLEIARLRALRGLLSRVLRACGDEAAAGDLWLHAESSRRHQTQRDPWVNLLRVTAEVFAGAVGGADAITAAPFDAALGPPGELGRRLARNTQLVLREESQLAQVIDPAGGSHYVERLTRELERAAWSEFQAIEAAGGMRQALLAGEIARRIAAIAQRRRADVTHRRIPITGVSEFPLLAEELPAPAPVSPACRVAAGRRLADQRAGQEAARRQAALAAVAQAGPGQRFAAARAAIAAGATLAEICAAGRPAPGATLISALPAEPLSAPFEALRARSDAHLARTGQRPRIFLASAGPLAEHNARTTWLRNFFEAGGIEAVATEESGDDPERCAAAFARSGAVLAALSAADARYPALVPALVPLLRQSGARAVLLAGRPGEHEASWRTAGIDQFVHVGCDVHATLDHLLDLCGAGHV